MKRLLIFDLDGTLLDTLDDLAASLNHALTSCCLPERSRSEVQSFIGNGVRLLVRLEPGDYQVYCNVGPEWFGTEYLFGKDAYFGMFDLKVERGSKSMIHMEDVDGNLPVTDLTEAEFHAAIGH